MSTSVLKEGAIDVKIGHSPSRFNLTQFKVSLMKRTPFEYSTFKTLFYTEPVSLIVGMLKSRQMRLTHEIVYSMCRLFVLSIATKPSVNIFSLDIFDRFSFLTIR